MSAWNKNVGGFQVRLSSCRIRRTRHWRSGRRSPWPRSAGRFLWTGPPVWRRPATATRPPTCCFDTERSWTPDLTYHNRYYDTPTLRPFPAKNEKTFFYHVSRVIKAFLCCVSISFFSFVIRSVLFLAAAEICGWNEPLAGVVPYFVFTFNFVNVNHVVLLIQFEMKFK